MKKTYETGLLGESAAESYLRENLGMTCLARRYRTRCGEIDLIMADGGTIVFVEVKTRLRAAPGSGLMAVDLKKQRRIARSAVLYLMEKGWLNRSVRFDAAEITASGIIHVPGAFQPGSMFYR